jgi:hypothetical protein
MSGSDHPATNKDSDQNPFTVSPSQAVSTVSACLESTRVFNMLNNITHCSVANAELLLTSLEVSIYDGRQAFISTFMKKSNASGAASDTASGASGTASGASDNASGVSDNASGVSDNASGVSDNASGVSGAASGAASGVTASHARDSSSNSRSIDRCSSAVEEVASCIRGSESMENIKSEIEGELNIRRSLRQPSKKPSPAVQDDKVGEKRAKKSVISTASVKETVVTSGTDIFDKMITGEDKLSHVEFATYIGAKSEPCQVHDRTECDYANLLSDYSSEHASIVYKEMEETGFIKSKAEMERINDLHEKLNKKFKSSIQTERVGTHVGQQTCRDCAADLFKIYKDHADTRGSLHVPATKVVLKMPYSQYRSIKNEGREQDNNDITTLLVGNDKPRGFDATSSWGSNLVNWYWAMGSCDAAVQAFDKDRHQIFAFQFTECVFEKHPVKGSSVKGSSVKTLKPVNIPSIKSKFLVVNRNKPHVGKGEHPRIDCIPLQFGHKTVECVFNPDLNAKIESARKGDDPQNPPFLCTYMPEVTLNHLSEKTDSANKPGEKSKDKSNGIPHWKDLHESFIKKCGTVFVSNSATFFRTETDAPQTRGDAIPDKITHMGITWVLTAVSQGPVSLDATLDKILLACSTVERRNPGCIKQPKWVVLSDMFIDNTNDTISECAKYIGFTCGSSAKERGDAGKYWDMFWTQKYLKTPCSFWSGDYLAVAATTAPGLAWGIIVNSTVTVLATEGKRPTIDAHELETIQMFVRGARQTETPYNFFISRIKMLLEYLAFTFIRDIISLIRNPVKDTPEQHVALDTILILCAALRSITKSVELKTNIEGNFQPEVAIDETYYVEITENLFNKFVPASPDSITDKFCSENGIYDRESYFRKLIPLARLDDALNKHSGLLWAYDYISAYNPDERLKTTDLFEIFNLHQPRRGNRGVVDIEKTFASVDVLCIAKMVRDTKSKRGADDQYNSWLQNLCTEKLDGFLKVNRCSDVFCEFVRFDMPRRLGGGVNRLRAYLDGQLFTAPRFCQQVEFSGVSDSLDHPVSPVRSARGSILLSSVGKPGKPPVGDDSQEPTLISSSQPRTLESVSQTCQSLTDTTNPEQFMTDMENAYACSQDTSTIDVREEMDQSGDHSYPTPTQAPQLKPLPGIGKAPSTKNNSTSRSGAAAGSGAAVVRSRRNPADVQRNFASGFGAAAGSGAAVVRSRRNPAATQGNSASPSGAAAVRSRRNPAATQGNSASPSGRARNPLTMAEKNKRPPWRGGNTKRTKRYKRNSNRRYKKNTTYSYRKHNRTIKRRKTRRRK